MIFLICCWLKLWSLPTLFIDSPLNTQLKTTSDLVDTGTPPVWSKIRQVSFSKVALQALMNLSDSGLFAEELRQLYGLQDTSCRSKGYHLVEILWTILLYSIHLYAPLHYFQVLHRLHFSYLAVWDRAGEFGLGSRNSWGWSFSLLWFPPF